MEGPIFKPPKALDLSGSGNVADGWRKFKQNYNIYMTATGGVGKPEEVKAAILLNFIGEDAVEIFNTFGLSEEEKKNEKEILKAFENYCIPKKNVVYERYQFYKRDQKMGEPFELFLTDIKKLAQSCEFENLKEQMIRDRIVLGVRDENVQERLLRTEGLTLSKAIDVCRVAEISKSQAKEVRCKEVMVETVKFKKQKQKTNSKGMENFKCRRCQKWHGPRECPAFGQKCGLCGLLNHFAASCRVKGKQKDDRVKNVKEVDVAEENPICISLVQVGNVNVWSEKLNVRGKQVNFKLDTGAQVNILPKYILDDLVTGGKLKPTSIILEAFCGTKIKPLGIISLECKHDTVKKQVEFVIVNDKFLPILGLTTCVEFNLIRKVSVVHYYESKEKFINDNSEIFEGLGKFSQKCKISLNENYKPIANPPRRVPFAIRDKLKQTLLSMENRGIISKVEEPKTGWVSNLVVVEKGDGTLRVCLDPRNLNLAIKYPKNVLIPTLEEVTEKLCNKKYFTVLDLKEGFWQVELDDESSHLCTFSSPVGCWKFNRLPFGLNMAPEYFQFINNKNFGDIPGVQIYFDDLLIAADTLEEHDRILKLVVDRAKDLGVKFNKNKIQFRAESVKYLGFVFSKDGMKIDPNRIKAIVMLENPKNKKDLQKILGMVNFFRQFIPNLSELTSSLRMLLKNDVTFMWLPDHTRALEEIKNKIVSAPVLCNFDAKKEITVQTDASQSGLGCCLLQGGKPVCYASRSLNDAERNYSQIEKEMLGIVFSTKKFHNYIYGKKINVITDHKPLVSLLQKEISAIASSRLQRMRIKLLKYNLNLQYLPGKYMFVADLLSRSYLKDELDYDDKWISETVHSVSRSLNITDEKRLVFKKATKQDLILTKLKNYYFNGWPNNINKVDDDVKFYFKLQSEIHVEDDLVFFNYRLFVPVSLREYILKLLHEPHFGIHKTKQKAREIVYWPGLMTEIENMIAKCPVCEKYRNLNTKEPLIPHDIPDIPFNKVGCDILYFEGKDYLVLKDYFSKWLELVPLKLKTTNSVIVELKKIFSVHGIPRQLIADNMPFNSFKFHEFAKQWNFEIITSSPHYPRSNGLAERAVQTCKSILKKCAEENKDFYLSLLEYRNTPISGLNVSPSQILFSRRCRTKVPIHSNLLKPVISNKEMHEQVENSQSSYKCYYDRNTKLSKPLKEGDKVVTYKNKVWEPARILQKHITPRSYIIEDKNGEVLRRNSLHLRKSLNEPKIVRNSVNFNDNVDNCVETETVSEENNSNNDCNLANKLESKIDVENNKNITRSGRSVRLPTRLRDYVINSVEREM